MKAQDVFTQIPGNLHIRSGTEDFFSIGKMLEASVIEIEKGRILLETGDGKLLNAAGEGNINVTPGEQLILEPTERKNGQLYMRIVERTNFPPNTANCEKILKQLGLKPGRTNMQIANALFDNSIRITEDIIRGIASLSSQIGRQSVKTSVFLLSKGIEPDVNTVQKMELIQNGKLLIDGLLKDVIDVIERAGDAEILQGAARKMQVYAHVRSIVNEFCSSEDMPGYLQNSQELLSAFTYKSIFVSSFSGVFEKTGLPEECKNFISKLLEHAGSRMEDQDFSHNGKAFLINEFGKVFRNPEKNEFARNIKSIYKELTNKIDILKGELAASNIPGREDLVATLEASQNNALFFDELSKYIPYVQIPLRLGNFETNGELYVMRRKRKHAASNKTGILLSLATQYMGHVDTFMEFYNKSVTVCIMTENRVVAEFLKRHKNSLSNIFSDLGYNLMDMRCSTGKKTGILDAERQIEKSSVKLNRIDCRI